MENKKNQRLNIQFSTAQLVLNMFSLLFFICVSQRTIAQSLNIDSLTQIIENNQPDEIRIDAAEQLTRAYLYTNPSQSSVVAKQMLDLAKKNNLPLTEAKALVLLGLSYEYRNADTDSTLAFFERALKIAQLHEDKVLEARTCYSMAGTYQRMGQLDKAFELNQKTLKIAQEHGEERLALITIRQIATILAIQKNHTKAIKYYQEGLKTATKQNDTELIGTFANNIGTMYYEMEQLDSALAFFEQSLDIMSTHYSTNKFATSTLTANIGNIYRKQKKFERANQYLTESYKIAKEANYVRGATVALGILSELYFDQQQYSKALNYAEKGLNLLGNTGEIGEEIKLNGLIKKSYIQQGKYQEAIEVDQIYEVLKDSLYKIESKQQIEELDVKYNVQQKELENEMLKTEQNKQILISRQRTALGVIAVLVAILMSVIAILQKRASNLKKQQNDILEQEVAKRTAELNKANYELKTFNYIASHDIKEPIRNIGSYAGLIFKKLPNDLKEEFSFYFKTIKTSSNQLYTLVEDFSKYTQFSQNSHIEKQNIDLNQTIDSITFGLQNIIAEKNGKIVSEDLPIIQSSASLMYTILKNLIENGLKYNQSENPTVTVSSTENEFFQQIRITDNGIGIKAEYHEQIFEMFKRLHNRSEYKGSGIGLAIVKLLTDKLDISVQLRSELGNGSTFILSFRKN